MEFNCPQCGKRLRAPDHLKNPLVRCRTCGTAFRPREQAEQPVTAQVVGPRPLAPPFRPVAPRPAAPSPPMPSRPVTSPPVASEAGQTVAKGLGIAVVVLFLLISKAPRLLKSLFDNRQPPAPVQAPDKDLRAIQELLEEARERPPLQPVPVDKPPAKDEKEQEEVADPLWDVPAQPPE